MSGTAAVGRGRGRSGGSRSRPRVIGIADDHWARVIPSSGTAAESGSRTGPAGRASG